MQTVCSYVLLQPFCAKAQKTLCLLWGKEREGQNNDYPFLFPLLLGRSNRASVLPSFDRSIPEKVNCATGHQPSLPGIQTEVPLINTILYQKGQMESRSGFNRWSLGDWRWIFWIPIRVRKNVRFWEKLWLVLNFWVLTKNSLESGLRMRDLEKN